MGKRDKKPFWKLYYQIPIAKEFGMKVKKYGYLMITFIFKKQISDTQEKNKNL